MRPTEFPQPTEIKLHRRSRELEIAFADGKRFHLPAELLRVYSPSEVLQVGKEAVAIDRVEPVGQYAVRLCFDDGHDTGLYDWRLLYELGDAQPEHWQDYLERLTAAGHERKTPGNGGV